MRQTVGRIVATIIWIVGIMFGGLVQFIFVLLLLLDLLEER